MSYRDDNAAGHYLADALRDELAAERARHADTRRRLDDEIAKRPKATNVALEVMAIVGCVFGTLGIIGLAGAVEIERQRPSITDSEPAQCERPTPDETPSDHVRDSTDGDDVHRTVMEAHGAHR